MILKIEFLSILLIITIFLICPANATTTKVTVLEDSYTDKSYASTNYGNDSHMQTFTGSNARYAYLKFNVPKYTTSAFLHVYTDGGYKNQGYVIVRTTTQDWSEDTITVKNPPTCEDTDSIIDLFNLTKNGQWAVLNVSSVVNYPGNYSFRIESKYGYNDQWVSKEGDQNYTPYLEISTGQQPKDISWNNKTKDDSKAFLVNTSESIFFNISAPDVGNISDFSWYVNKINEFNNNTSLIFTIPSYNLVDPSTNIWEIRVEGNYTNGTNVTREWLISSLNISQAPNFIDFFIDQNSARRNDRFLDPWGRSMPIYLNKINYAANGYVSRTTSNSYPISKNLNLKYGTYIVKVFQNAGITQEFQYKFIDNTTKNSIGLQIACADMHDYFAINNPDYGYIPISKRWIDSAPGGRNWAGEDRKWREYRFIINPDGYIYLYENGILVHRSSGYYDPKLLKNLTQVQFMAGANMGVDCAQIYSNRYLYPDTNISYGNYSKYWDYHSSSSYTVYDDSGIIINTHNATLKQISDTINNESLITYDGSSKIATVKTNMFLTAGSILNVYNETLLFDTSSKPLFIRPELFSVIKINNSTVSTTSDNPLIWNFVTPISLTIFDPVGSRKWTSLGYASGNPCLQPEPMWRGRLNIVNSTINNTCNMYLEGANEIILDNVIFSNMSSSTYGVNDYAAYSVTAADRAHQQALASGNKSLRFVPLYELSNFIVNNVSFVNPKDHVTLESVGGEFILNQTLLKNCDLSNIYVSTKQSYKLETLPDYRYDNEKSNLVLLNCKFTENNLSVKTGNAKLKTKYYAVVSIKDTQGKPVQNATISISSSDTNYKAENSYSYSDYYEEEPRNADYTNPGYFLNHPLATFGPGGGGATNYGSGYIDENGTLHGTMQNITCRGGWWNRIYNENNLTTATTNSEGRTSLPSEDVNNTIVLTDNVFSNETGIQLKKSIRYNFKISTPNSVPFYIKDVDPDSTWYRKDPLVSAYTINAIIPDNSSKGPHLIGFAPSEENPFNPGEKKIFRVWTDETLNEMNWYVDGIWQEKSKGAMNFTWNVTGGIHMIKFTGNNSNGPITKEWKVGGGSSPIAEFFPQDTELIKNTSEPITFSVSSGEVSNTNWFINGQLVKNGTASLTQSWDMPGMYNVTFSGSVSGVSVMHSWSVLVDTAPVLALIGPKSVSESSNLTFKVNASDADGNNNLTFSASGLPSGATFNPTTGVFNWVPSKGQAGSYTVTFNVNDGYLSDSEAVKITVTNVNSAPVITSLTPANGSVFTEGQRINTTISASDADMQSLKYTIKIDGKEYSTSPSYIWITNYSNSGNHTIEGTVSDGITTVNKVCTIQINDYHPRWDVNKDDVVDFDDINKIAQNYGIVPKYPYPDWDVNQDGVVNLKDLTLAESYFGETVE